MNKKELIIYETPEWVYQLKFDWLRNFIERRIRNKVNKKYQDYLDRKFAMDQMPPFHPNCRIKL